MACKKRQKKKRKDTAQRTIVYTNKFEGRRQMSVLKIEWRSEIESCEISFNAGIYR